MPRMLSSIRVALALSLLASATLPLAACGKDEAITDPGSLGGGGSMTASVDGSGIGGIAAVQAVRAGTTLNIAAVTTTQRQITLSLVNVTGPGTFSLGTNSGNLAQYIQGTQAWVSSTVGGSGTLTITTLTSSRAVGTFSFTGIAATNTGATGTKTVSNGTFDVTF